MSSVVLPEVDGEDPPELCEFCGGEIRGEDQDCPALFRGRCRP